MDAKLRNYLWSGTENIHRKAKVSWDDVCLPKEEWGLGIKKVCEWNKAAMCKHLWDLARKKDSLWVKWCHIFMLKGRNLWVCPIANGSSWAWRKILGLRRHFHQCFHTAIGDGKDTWIWYDKWVTSELLVDMYGMRIIYDAASTKNAKVAVLLSNQGWILPAPISHGLSEFRRMLQEGIFVEKM